MGCYACQAWYAMTKKKEMQFGNPGNLAMTEEGESPWPAGNDVMCINKKKNCINTYSHYF